MMGLFLKKNLRIQFLEESNKIFTWENVLIVFVVIILFVIELCFKRCLDWIYKSLSQEILHRIMCKVIFKKPEKWSNWSFCKIKDSKPNYHLLWFQSQTDQKNYGNITRLTAKSIFFHAWFTTFNTFHFSLI